MDKQEDRAGDSMRLEQILYLVEIERYKSMNAAAKELHVTQQNLSSAIKRLEEELQLTLITRTSKGVALTKDGDYVASLGRELLDKADKIVHYAQQRALQKDDGDRLDGSIRINISANFVINILALLWRCMRVLRWIFCKRSVTEKKIWA